MSSKLFLCVGLLLIIAGCQKTDVDSTSPESASQAPVAETGPAAGRETQNELDPSEVVWADELFLDVEGVKEGKDVIYLPTPPMVVDKMIELADIQKDELVYDLGTGDGRIAIAVAKQIGCKVIGYEYDPALVEKARENVRKNGVEHLVTIVEQDVLELDMSPADVVLMYLTRDLNIALIPQFRELKPGSRIVSHDWGMGDLVETDIVIENFVSKVPDFVNVHSIYLWKTPLRPKK